MIATDYGFTTQLAVYQHRRAKVCDISWTKFNNYKLYPENTNRSEITCVKQSDPVRSTRSKAMAEQRNCLANC
jgi:hypothetical protein